MYGPNACWHHDYPPEWDDDPDQWYDEDAPIGPDYPDEDSWQEYEDDLYYENVE